MFDSLGNPIENGSRVVWVFNEGQSRLGMTYAEVIERKTKVKIKYFEEPKVWLPEGRTVETWVDRSRLVVL